MVKVKQILTSVVAVCIAMGTAAGAVAVKISRNVRENKQICVVVDAGHGAYA